MLDIVSPHNACFGEKDFQQLSLVRQLVRDLNIPIEIAGVPTVREEDGLAMSSRNVRLSAEDRVIAPQLHTALVGVRDAVKGGKNVATALRTAKSRLIKAGFSSIDYLELRAEDNLESVKNLKRPARLLVAAWLGDVRLIDNIPVN